MVETTDILLRPVTRTEAKHMAAILNGMARDIGKKLRIRRMKKRKGESASAHKASIEGLELEMQALLWAADHMNGVPHATITDETALTRPNVD